MLAQGRRQDDDIILAGGTLLERVHLVLPGRIADIVDPSEARLSIEVTDGSVGHGELMSKIKVRSISGVILISLIS